MSSREYEHIREGILCVEDNPEALDLMISLLANRFPGLKLYAAQDGETGLGIFLEHRPGIVITDLLMLGMDGFALAGKIRELNSDTLIIGVSAHSRKGYDRNSQIQFDHYLHKPLNFFELSTIIQNYIGRMK